MTDKAFQDEIHSRLIQNGCSFELASWLLVLHEEVDQLRDLVRRLTAALGEKA